MSKGIQRDGPRRISVIAVVILIICAALSAAVLGRPGTSDVADATREYVRAYVELAKDSRAALPRTEAIVGNVAHLVAKGCPNVLAGSGTADHGPAHTEQINQVEEEINGALQVADARATQREAVRFSQQLARLRWSDAALMREVQLLAGVATAVTRLPVAPDICMDMKQWAKTGFRQLPMTTGRFNTELESAVQSAGGQGDIEGSINRKLSRNAAGPERNAIRRASRLMSRTQERELDAVIAGRNEIFRHLGLRNPKVS